MYAKLVLRNVRRSVKDYLIYIVTLTICVTLFYGFLSVSSRYYSPDIGVEYDLNILSDGMRMAICMITLLLLFLIRYVNNYMICRRQKEFAVQTIMGMEQSTTAKLFFAETLVMGGTSIVLGIVFGMIGSQFVTAMLLSSYGQPFRLSWALFPDTVLLTIAFFMGTFLVIGLWNIRIIRKIKILDMLNAEKRNEEDFRRGRDMPVVTFLYGIMLVIMAGAGLLKAEMYYDSRLALPVRIMFWGNIAVPLAALLFLAFWFVRKKWKFRGLLLVWMFCSAAAACFAASVPMLRMKYYLALDAGAINQYLLFLCVDMVFGICSFIYLFNDFICIVKEKFPKHRYHRENLFFYGQIISKLRTTTKTMTLICLTLVFSICLFMAAPALVGWASGYLEARAVYDVQIFSGYNQVSEVENLPAGDYELVTMYLEENNIKIESDCLFNLYLPRKEAFHQRMKYDFPAAAISLTDYNYILSMHGYEPVPLKDNEFTTQWRSISDEEQQREFFSTHASLLTEDKRLQLAPNQQYEYALGETIYNSYTDVLYVLPDSACENLLPVMRNRYIKTTEPIPYEKAQNLEKLISKKYGEQEYGPDYYIRTSTMQINSSKAGSFVLQVSMTYGAIVLLVMCFTILSLQQLADAGHYRYRFGVLGKLGVEEPRINRLILRQLSVWFGLPVIAASVVSTVLTAYFFKAMGAQISAYVGTKRLTGQVLEIIFLLLLLLFCYFISTWILFRRSVR